MLGGGAEKVVEKLLELFPDAPLYTSCINKQWRSRLKGRAVRTGYLNWWLFVKFRKFLPLLRRRWFASLDLNDFDIIICSSGAEAKGVKASDNQLYIAYIQAPTHYYWSRYDSYLKHPGFGLLDPLARLGLKLLVKPMRRWDFKAAQRPDFLVTNSSHTQSEIKKYYRRDSVIIHPPVDTRRFKLTAQDSKLKAPKEAETEKMEDGRWKVEDTELSTPDSVLRTQYSKTHLPTTTPQPLARKGLITAGRQVPYKRFDLAIAACNELSLPLTVIGNGPEHGNLKKLAGPTIKFIDSATDADMAQYFQEAEGFIFPGLDDFGITPVEAMSAGCPVVAYKAGGSLDYVVSGKTGLFFERQTVSCLVNTLQKLPRVSFDARVISEHAENFNTRRFMTSMQKFINDKAQQKNL